MAATGTLSSESAIARRIVSLMDLTSLNETDDEAAIVRLSGLAVSKAGSVAAVCVWPRFIPVARNALRETGVRIAVVTNFPEGAAGVEQAAVQLGKLAPAAAEKEGSDDSVQPKVARPGIARHERQIIQALAQLPCPGRAYLPEVPHHGKGDILLWGKDGKVQELIAIHAGQTAQRDGDRPPDGALPAQRIFAIEPAVQSHDVQSADNLA